MNEYTPKAKWKPLSEISSRKWTLRKKTEPTESKYQDKSLRNWKTHKLTENFKKFRRETQRYALGEWTTPEKINKAVAPYLKKHSTETAMVVNSIYKITENTRFQAKVTMEIFEQFQYVLEEADHDEAKDIIGRCREQSQRLAVFGLATAKAQEREAKEYSDEALNIPPSICHLETTEEDSKSKNAYSDEFLNKYHQANFERKLVQQASSNRGGGRGNGFSSRGYQRGNRNFGYGRGNNRARGAFFGQGTSQRWGTQHNSNLAQQQSPH